MGELHRVGCHRLGHPEHPTAQDAHVPGYSEPPQAPLGLDHADRLHATLHAFGKVSVCSKFTNILPSLGIFSTIT